MTDDRTPEELAAVDQAYFRALELLSRPLSRQAKRDGDRAAATVRRLQHLEANRRRGVR